MEESGSQKRNGYQIQEWKNVQLVHETQMWTLQKASECKLESPKKITPRRKKMTRVCN